ncbi:hypothetical protein ACU686_11880 [Yinghuangia aomiensis]
MGQTRFYPVFESDDLDAAYAAAKRLLALSDTDELLTTLWAEAPDKSVLDRLSDVLAQPDTPVTISQQDDGDSRPGWWSLEAWSRSDRSIEVPFLQAAKHLVASVGWEVAWPGGPRTRPLPPARPLRSPTDAQLRRHLPGAARRRIPGLRPRQMERHRRRPTRRMARDTSRTTNPRTRRNRLVTTSPTLSGCINQKQERFLPDSESGLPE